MQFTLAEARVDDDEISDPPDAVGLQSETRLPYAYTDTGDIMRFCFFLTRTSCTTGSS